MEGDDFIWRRSHGSCSGSPQGGGLQPLEASFRFSPHTRKHAGETAFRLFHTVDDPREVILFLDWDSIEQARKFMKSDDLRKAMQQAGVEGAPDVQYIEDVRTVHRSAAD